MNTANSQVYINTPREEAVISLLNSYLGSYFEVIKKADNSRYGNGNDSNDIRLVNLGPIALFRNFELTTYSCKHLEDFSNAHTVSSLKKLVTSANDTDVLSFGFNRNLRRSQEELTKNKNKYGKNWVRVMLRDVFGFADYQEKATFLLG